MGQACQNYQVAESMTIIESELETVDLSSIDLDIFRLSKRNNRK